MLRAHVHTHTICVMLHTLFTYVILVINKYIPTIFLVKI